MPLIIQDEVLQNAHLTEQEARVEFACRLFEAGRLELWPAAQIANLSRGEFEAELAKRNIPAYRPDINDFEQDMNTLAWMKKQDDRR